MRAERADANNVHACP